MKKSAILLIFLASLSLSVASEANVSLLQIRGGRHGKPPHSRSKKLGFSELKAVLVAANKIVTHLAISEVRQWTGRAERGDIFLLTLSYQQQNVAQVLVNDKGNFLPLLPPPRGRRRPTPPLGQKVHVNSSQLKQWQQNLHQLQLSGLVQPTPKHYRLLLLWRGRPVGMLQLSQQNLQPSRSPKPW